MSQPASRRYLQIHLQTVFLPSKIHQYAKASLWVMQEQEQAWALSSIGLELSHAAAWDARTQHFYAVAAVRPVAAKASSAGFRQRLLGWPASFDQPLEEAPISIELHTAVHSVHPIFPTSTADSLSGSGSEAVPVGVGKEQQHHSSSGTEKVSAGAAQKQKAGSVQQNGALLHTMLPPIRTKSKLKPGKQKPADAKTAAQLPWMLDWIATGMHWTLQAMPARCEAVSLWSAADFYRHSAGYSGGCQSCDRQHLAFSATMTECCRGHAEILIAPCFFQGGRLRTGVLRRGMRALRA